MLSDVKVLLLDDEPLIRLMVASELEEHGAIVQDVGTCAEALSLARNQSFDVAVFDHNLPDGNCVDLLCVLRAEKNPLPALILSGEANRVVDDVADLTGVINVLAKPPNLAEVVTTLKKGLGFSSVQAGEALLKVGRYRCLPPRELDALSEEDRMGWLAFDFRNETCLEVSESMRCLLAEGSCRLAMIGGDELLKTAVLAVNADVEFVEDEEALGALSRHRNLNAERAALLRDVVQQHDSGA